jgi:hypothetical protein
MIHGKDSHARTLFHWNVTGAWLKSYEGFISAWLAASGCARDDRRSPGIELRSLAAIGLSTTISQEPPGTVCGVECGGNLEIAHHIGRTADFSGFYPGPKSVYVPVWPQASFRVNRVTSFAHFLAGEAIVRTSGS